MKATGIVRRIDDLGRVVIPKEIRRTLRIREGDPLEIFTDREGEVILKKYSPIGELGTLAKIYAESLAQTLGCTVCITDVKRESGLYPDHARYAGISAPGDLPDHQRGGCDRRGRPSGKGSEERLRGSGEPGGRQRGGFPRAADESVKSRG